MKTTVSSAVRQLKARKILLHTRDDHSDKIIQRVGELLGRKLPSDLVEFYREQIMTVAGHDACLPWWNDWVGWHSTDAFVTHLAHADAVPLFWDGCGSLFGLDLTPGVETPSVYFFDHEDGYERARWAAGSSLGAFLLLFADHDRAYDEQWPLKWQLKIDPEIEKCPRAPAIWDAG